MSKFREIRAQRREEVSTQWQMFLSVFESELAPAGVSPARLDVLRTVMWASWRACAYTNGFISEPAASTQQAQENRL